MATPRHVQRAGTTSGAGPALPELCAIFGYRRLAARVIEQALRDLEGPSLGDRSSARAFLAGSSMLWFWCDLAQIRPANVMARAASDWRTRGSSGARERASVAG